MRRKCDCWPPPSARPVIAARAAAHGRVASPGADVLNASAMVEPAPAVPAPPAAAGVAGFGWTAAAALVVLALTVFRVAVLAAAGHTLYPDEAQYWSWAQDPAWGYFSKPPLIAWAIAASTAVFGDGEFGVRVASPLLHAVTALVIGAIARALYDDRTGFWAAVVYATAPAVWFSSALISTDVPLLAAWALALLAVIRLREGGRGGWAVVLGVAVGLGLLAKYAMAYFVVATALVLLVDYPARRALLGGKGVVALLIAAAMIAPNILWNRAHDFATVAHTAANANWSADLFHADELLKFVGDQFGVFGPLLFAAFLLMLARPATWRHDPRAVLLVLYSLPVLLIVAGQAFLSRANANWAVAAYVAAPVLVVAWLAARGRWWRLVPVSVGLHSVVGIVFAAVLIWPGLTDAVGAGAALKRVRGWDALGERVAEAAAAAPYTAVLTNDRLNHAAILYYARGRTPTVRAWDYDGVPQHHYEQFAPLTADVAGRVLLVSRWELSPGDDPILRRFADVRPLGQVDVAVGGGKVRSAWLYDLSGLRPVP